MTLTLPLSFLSLRLSTEEPTSSDSAVFVYPNDMPAATTFYHDHTMGLTRLNVLAGMAGFYLIKDPSESATLPSGKYEIPLALQDRTFNTDGSIHLNSNGINPDLHPNWNPEYFGNTIVVNGKVWPNLQVDRGAYRFRLLNGADSRFFDLTLVNEAAPGVQVPWTMIGTKAGFLARAVPNAGPLLMAPGERIDLLVDFSAFAAGTKLLLVNKARTPYPSGDLPDPATTGQVMRFTVGTAAGIKMPNLAGIQNPNLVGTFPTLAATNLKRNIVLTEIQGVNGPLGALFNGLSYMSPATEIVTQGSTEDWIIINLTADTHPIHLHLAGHQLVSRQNFDADAYQAAWLSLNNASVPFPNGFAVKSLDPTPYLQGTPIGPAVTEQGWKDTTKANPGQATIIRVRFAKKDGKPFSFDPTIGAGYVAHCHILSHEVSWIEFETCFPRLCGADRLIVCQDNDMMRPLVVVK